MVVGVLISKPGITSASTLSIPKDWSPSWFRNLIENQLKGADVRNAVGSGGISVSGNIASPYATIGFKAPIILPGTVTINYNSATGAALSIDTNSSGPFSIFLTRTDIPNTIGIWNNSGVLQINSSLGINSASGGNIGFSTSSFGAYSTTLNFGCAGGGIVELQSNGVNAIFLDGAANILFPNIGTTANSATAYLDPSGNHQLLRSTSSQRYKTDICTLLLDDAKKLLQLRPVRFRSICPADDPSVIHYGLIAEEVATIEPSWAYWMSSSDGLIPDGVQYDRLVVPLIFLVQKLTRDVAQLKGEI